jgi:vacuolar iron transporter family protein
MNLKLPLREIIFGMEDGTVSTLGVIVGIAAGTNNRYVVVLSGFVVIFVESLSMAAGTFLSNKSNLEAHIRDDKHNLFARLFHHHSLFKDPAKESLSMGLSYVLGGMVSLLFFLFLPPLVAILPAVIISLAFLFVVGFFKGKIVEVNPFRSGIEMMSISASAAAIGYTIGKLVPLFFQI